MATVGGTYLDLADLFKAEDGSGRAIAEVIEMLAEMNPILQHAPVIEANDGRKNLTTIRTGLPSVAWRTLYKGVQPSKSTTTQVEDTAGLLEAWSEVDAYLIDIAPNPARFRANETASFLEAMNQEWATGLFYHSTKTAPEKMHGLAPRFNSLSAPNASQIIDAGGTGSDNTSVWFIVWGERTAHLFYPRGTKGGIEREDKGKETTKDANGGLYDVYREKFTLSTGFSLRDWRYVSRIANIDVSNLAAGTVDVEDFMIDAYYALKQRKIANGVAAIYCNIEVKKALHKAARDKSNVNLTISETAGQEYVKFLGIPIYEVEAILNTEAQVV